MSNTLPDAEILGQDLASQLRNMEEFASLGQFLFLFGVDVLKLPDFEREVRVQPSLSGIASDVFNEGVGTVAAGGGLRTRQEDSHVAIEYGHVSKRSYS